jgi:hypothetical protein
MRSVCNKNTMSYRLKYGFNLCGIETRWSCEEQNVDSCPEEMEKGLDVFSQ